LSKRVLVDRDIWSCGVLLFKLLTGTYPFSNEAGKLAPNKIKNATFSFPKL
jgi:serine/threonine protein kinase